MSGLDPCVFLMMRCLATINSKPSGNFFHRNISSEYDKHCFVNCEEGHGDNLLGSYEHYTFHIFSPQNRLELTVFPRFLSQFKYVVEVSHLQLTWQQQNCA